MGKRERERKKKVVGSGSSDDEALQGNARLYTETCSVFMHCDEYNECRPEGMLYFPSLTKEKGSQTSK